MTYFRSLPGLLKLLEKLARDQRWLIVINADPDAMASAMALKRILSHRVQDVVITRVNEVSRPDNMAMVRYTRLHMTRFYPGMLPHFDYFAIVDSQPHHHPAFTDIPFSVIIDHHPLPETAFPAAYIDIKPQYGATSTLLTEYLYNLDILPGKLLATALQFGIKTDTDNFERHFYDVDLRAYQYLNRFADPNLLSRIARSEFHLRWLDMFAKACTNLYGMGASGQYVFIGEVDNPDILVNIADFFMHVYEIRWAAVSGKYKDTVVVVFRGDGISKDVGQYAARVFGDIGLAGGHKAMARAEFPAEVAGSDDLEMFIWKKLNTSLRRVRKPAAGAASAKAGGEPGQTSNSPDANEQTPDSRASGARGPDTPAADTPAPDDKKHRQPRRRQSRPGSPRAVVPPVDKPPLSKAIAPPDAVSGASSSAAPGEIPDEG